VMIQWCGAMGTQTSVNHVWMPVALGRLTETIFPRIYARTYYAHPRARVMSFSAREPARFPSGNPPHALRLQHMAHTLVATAPPDSIGRAIIHTNSVTICVSKRIFLL
jgi:hypothetical protein